MDGTRSTERVYFVKAEYDSEAQVWYVSNSDVPGLAAEAGSPEELLALLHTLIPELIEANGDGRAELPFSVIFDHLRAKGSTAAA